MQFSRSWIWIFGSFVGSRSSFTHAHVCVTHLHTAVHLTFTPVLRTPYLHTLFVDFRFTLRYVYRLPARCHAPRHARCHGGALIPGYLLSVDSPLHVYTCTTILLRLTLLHFYTFYTFVLVGRWTGLRSLLPILHTQVYTLLRHAYTRSTHSVLRYIPFPTTHTPHHHIPTRGRYRTTPPPTFCYGCCLFVLGYHVVPFWIAVTTTFVGYGVVVVDLRYSRCDYVTSPL